MESRIYTRTSEDSQVFNEAFDLYSLGHRDMIDNILYATSLRHGLRFLTVDRELREFVTEKRLENTLMHPDQLP